MSHLFERQVATWVKEQQLIKPDNHVVVACSAGPDSCSLLAVLAALQHSLIPCAAISAVYINHGLRKQAAQEGNYVEQLAKQLGCESHVISIDIDKNAHVQEQARNKRYQVLLEYVASLKNGVLATGHTADDVVESVLINLTRGSGPEGLGGIPVVRDNIVRPILSMWKEDVLQYLAYCNIEPKLDASNATNKYLRNRIRNQLLPLWKELGSHDIQKTIWRFSQVMKDDSHYMNQQALAVLSDIEIQPQQLDVKALLNHHGAIQKRVIRLWLQRKLGEGFRPSYQLVQEILAICIVNRGKLRLPDGLHAVVRDKVLQFES